MTRVDWPLDEQDEADIEEVEEGQGAAVDAPLAAVADVCESVMGGLVS